MRAALLASGATVALSAVLYPGHLLDAYHPEPGMTKSQIVGPDAVWIANPTPTPTATLYACHPKHSKKYRYVVFLDLVS